MSVGVGHQLIALFCGGVKVRRVINPVVFGERHVAIVAVHRTRRCKYEVFAAVVTRALENVQESSDVGIDIGLGVFEGVAHPRLSGEVYKPLWAFHLDQIVHRLRVTDIDPVKGKA